MIPKCNPAWEPVSTPAAVSDVVKRKAQGEGGAPEANKEESATGRAPQAKVLGCCEAGRASRRRGKGGEDGTPNGETSSQVFGAPAIAIPYLLYPFYLFKP